MLERGGRWGCLFELGDSGSTRFFTRLENRRGRVNAVCAWSQQWVADGSSGSVDGSVLLRKVVLAYLQLFSELCELASCSTLLHFDQQLHHLETITGSSARINKTCRPSDKDLFILRSPPGDELPSNQSKKMLAPLLPPLPASTWPFELLSARR